MVVSSRRLLARRIAELDAAPLQWPGRQMLSAEQLAICPLLAHFANVMSRYTDTFMDAETGKGSMIDPILADEMTTHCSLVSRIGELEPSLIRFAARPDRQHWTRTARHILGPGETPAPHESSFVTTCRARGYGHSVKPLDRGLYTSTATSAGCSMWRALLGPNGSMLYPRPWFSWEMVVDQCVRVAEITSATKWVDFVCSYASSYNGVVYPEWVKIAQEFDAVHIAVPAIVAGQGFHFGTSLGVIPPAFWDVETTFWLRWRFAEVHLIETVGGE
jgi:hypothetical protein